jgi:outer membrane protein TolC
MKTFSALLAAAMLLALGDQQQAASSNNDTEAGIATGAIDALQSLSTNPIVATNKPSAADQSLLGASVGTQVNAQIDTNLPVYTTNTPTSNDQSVTGLSVMPALTSNLPVTPQGLNAGTNTLPNLPTITAPNLPTAPMITNPITLGSLMSPLPTSTGGPITMPTVSTNAFGLKNSVKDIPLTADALAKAGNAVIPGVIAKNARKLTIDDCVQLTLQKNPQILSAIDSIRQASGNYITVRAGLLPQIGFTNASYQYSYGQIYQGVNPLGGSRSDQGFQSWSIQLGGSQLLFDGWKTPSLNAAAKMNEKIAYFQLRQTIDSNIATVVQQFYQVVLDRALVIANEQQVALYQTQVTDQQSRYDAGTVPRFNVLQAQVQLANAEPPLIQAKNNLRIALFTLVTTIGLNYPNMQNIEIPFDVVGNLDYHPRKIDSNASIHTALVRNPQLKAQRMNILVAAKQITAAIAGWMPTVYANGGRQLEGFEGRNQDSTLGGWFVGATGSWAIFDGLATYGNVKSANATMMNYKVAYDNGVRQVILQVQQAISNIKQASETIDSQKATVEQAVEALRLSRERLDAGAGVQLDVINAQVQLLQAQTSVLNAYYSYIQGLAQYDQALSLNTQYEEFFNDPMNKWEQRRYKDITDNHKQRPELPRALRKDDPLPPKENFNDLIKSSTVRKQEQGTSKASD